MENKKGILYSVSLGPGDPELVTIKAKRIVDECAVIAAPTTKGTNNMALDILRGCTNIDGKEIIYCDFPMVSAKAALDAAHTKIAEDVKAKLDQGKDVAFINIGDVSIYSTVSYISDIITEWGYESIWIPGVSSITACACTLGISLTSMKKPLHIFPGSFQDIDAALDMDGSKVIMKSASKIAGVRDAIAKRDVFSAAVNDCSLPTQKVYRDAKDIPDNTGYFTTIIVKDK